MSLIKDSDNVFDAFEHRFENDAGHWQRMSRHIGIDNDLDAATRQTQLEELLKVMLEDKSIMEEIMAEQKQDRANIAAALKTCDEVVANAAKKLPPNENALLTKINTTLKEQLAIAETVTVGFDVAYKLKLKMLARNDTYYKALLAARKALEAGKPFPDGAELAAEWLYTQEAAEDEAKMKAMRQTVELGEASRLSQKMMDSNINMVRVFQARMEQMEG
ncbi:uncharacterized protein AB675_5252 [Cyphellophora attinorum]|uniref:Uncharacterized protein n=1 Tax=Cyphellophora attinorum TaxID=1664694 RepID=A0A0N0NLS6_9EURO|nr:uncharacterized protein AB675_5252 [Phialophora attinorum]KPI39379.1 hypothetical protein AB675_5252 [Phialophora attinorum]